MIKYILFVSILLTFSIQISAQNFEEKAHVIKGNQEYNHADYLKAESQYKIALSKDAKSVKANYNLGNALYQQKKFDEARAHYDHVIQNENATQLDKAKAFHNTGKAYFDEKEFEKAAQNFKKSLKLNPEDDETRYNYALAKKKFEEQQEKEKPNNQDSEDSDQKGDNKENDGSENEKEGQDQDSQKDGNQSEQQQNQQGNEEGGEDGNEKGDGDRPQEQKITKGSDGKGPESENAVNTDRQEGMLDALRQQEQETLKKIISNKAQNVRSNSEKDW